MHARLCLALYLLIPTTVSAFDFKGITVGSYSTPEQIFQKLGVKCGVGASNMQICNGTVTIGRENAQMNLVINAVGVVQRINLTLSPSSFDVVAPLLIEKFGVPTKTDRSEVQNRMGAKFDQVTHYWRGSGELEVLYQKYAGTLNSSTLYFSTKEDREILMKPKANRRDDI